MGERGLEVVGSVGKCLGGEVDIRRVGTEVIGR